MIIALIPSPGHEYLTAEGPFGERPALLVQVDSGRWEPMRRGLLSHSGTRALVLYAPGEPKLGMVRLREALEMSGEAYGWSVGLEVPAENERDTDDILIDHLIGRATTERGDDQSWSVPHHPLILTPPPGRWRTGVETPEASAYADAHLAHQRGLVAEVLVLPLETS